MTSGAIATVCALAVATAFGLYWKTRNGRLVRQGRATARPMEVAPAGRAAGPGPDADSSQAMSGGGFGPDALSPDDLGTPLGARATLVQFSSAFCAPCRATRRILTDVSELLDGVTHVEIDAESRLDLVRRLDVRRTPTTFVLGPDGRVTHRASGQPRKADVIAALGAAL